MNIDNNSSLGNDSGGPDDYQNHQEGMSVSSSRSHSSDSSSLDSRSFHSQFPDSHSSDYKPFAENSSSSSFEAPSVEKHVSSQKRISPKKWWKSPFVLWTLIFLALISCLWLPTNYAVESPGPTFNVLGVTNQGNTLSPIISIGNPVPKENNSPPNKKNKKDKKTKENKTDSAPQSSAPLEILMVTINAEGIIGKPVPVWQAIGDFFNSQRNVIPKEAIRENNTSLQQFEQKEKAEMTDSQNSAIAAAMKEIQTLQSKSIDGSEIRIAQTTVGGPSAGLAYALGVVEKIMQDPHKNELLHQSDSSKLMTHNFRTLNVAYKSTHTRYGESVIASNETFKRPLIVAATGVISPEGAISQVGGLRLKLLAAHQAGAQWMFVPQSEYTSIEAYIPNGLKVIPVSTLGQAYQELQRIKGSSGDITK